MDQVIPRVPVRQWVLSLAIALRLLLAAQPQLVTPVLQVVLRLFARHLRACEFQMLPARAETGSRPA